MNRMGGPMGTKITAQAKADLFDRILAAAHIAAAQAARRTPETWACGFAWVTIDGASPLARHCRAKLKPFGPHPKWEQTHGFGSKGYPRGWQFWGPGASHTQSINVKEAAAVAFRDKLAEFGIVATTGSRLD